MGCLPMNPPVLRLSTDADFDGILALYRAVAAVEGGLARAADEVTPQYVAGNLRAARERGLALVAVDDGQIVGELHASRPEPRVFAHVLGDLTVAVHPRCQGRGIGRALFGALLDEVRERRPEILRIELIARESNARALALYESLGFVREGRLRGRIRGVGGRFEDDIPMAWCREGMS